MNKCYVKAYYDWIEQTAALSDAERGRLFIAVLEYARSGLEPKLDGRESILFPVFQATIDRDNQKSKTNSQNGALGGRGNKANESETKRPKATESEQEATKDIRQKTQEKGHKTQEKEEIISREDAPPAPDRRKYGAYGWVRLTDEEHQRLLTDLGEDELERCIGYIDESAQSNGNKNKWKDWNLVIRKCSRDGWGIDRTKPERSCKTTTGNNAWMKDYL